MQISNPASSGTAYTAVATLVQLMGEEPAVAYLKALHENVNQYTRSGPAPARNTARGETAVGVMFLHDAVAEAVEGFPVKTVAPCEGTGYEIGSMSLIKGGRNGATARRWYDWALTAEAQALAARAKSYQVPSNRSAPVPARAPRLADIKLIDYDFAKYGQSAEREAPHRALGAGSRLPAEVSLREGAWLSLATARRRRWSSGGSPSGTARWWP